MSRRQRTLHQSWPAGSPEAQHALDPARRPRRGGRRLERRRRRRPFRSRKDRSRATSERCRRPLETVDESIRYRIVIPWFGWLFALPVRSTLRHRPHDDNVPWWSPPDRLTERNVATLGLLAAASMAAAFANTLFTQTASFAADGFGIDERAQGVGGVIVRLGVVIAIPVRAPRRPSRTASDHRHHRVAGAVVVRARRPRSELLGPRRHADHRPADRAGARSADRRRRRRGDAAQQPRVRAQRARAGGRARRRRRRCRASTRRPRARRLAARVPAVADLAAAGVQPHPAPARDAPIRTAAHHCTGARSSPLRHHLDRRDQRQPLRRSGVVLPEPLPRRRARLHGRRNRFVHAVHRDAGVVRVDRRRTPRRHGRSPRRAGDLHAASRRC